MVFCKRAAISRGSQREGEEESTQAVALERMFAYQAVELVEDLEHGHDTAACSFWSAFEPSDGMIQQGKFVDRNVYWLICGMHKVVSKV